MKGGEREQGHRPLSRPQENPPFLSPPQRGCWAEHLQGLTKMLLDSVQDVHAVLAVNHVHSQAPLAKAAGAPDPVEVGLIVWVPVLVHRKIEVDDDRHLFDIDTCTVAGGGERQRSQGGTQSHSQSAIPTSGGGRGTWDRPALDVGTRKGAYRPVAEPEREFWHCQKPL